jgi:high affinity sulfate transporter 1
MIPAAMAYAQLAGVPAQYGLYAAMAALAIYPLFATSRHVRVTMSSTMAVMSASIVAPLVTNGGELLVLTAGLALVVGVILVIAGLLRLGFLGDFLSKPVITGFLFGLGINIIVGQLPKILGIPAGSGNSVQQFLAVVRGLPQTSIFTLAIGLGAAFLIIRLRQLAPQVPGSLIAVIYGILVGKALPLESYGVSTVGLIPTGLPAFGFPHISPGDLAYLLAGAGAVVFLALGESLAAARVYAARHHYRIDSDNELLAIGAANVGSAFVGGVTVDASMSTTATSEAAGSRTQVASWVTSALTVLTVLFLAGLLQDLPNAVLAAVVINSVVGLLNREEMRRFYRASRVDFLMGLTALLGVVLSDPASGLMLAVFLSLGVVLFRASRPRVAALGRVKGRPHEFADLGRASEVEEVPGLVILRLEAGLFYANANEVKRAVEAEVDKRDPPPRGVLLDLGATGFIDLTSIDMLRDLLRAFNNRSMVVLLTHVVGQVRDQLRQAEALEEIGSGNIVPTLAGGVQRFLDQENRLERATPAGPGPMR